MLQSSNIFHRYHDKLFQLLLKSVRKRHVGLYEMWYTLYHYTNFKLSAIARTFHRLISMYFAVGLFILQDLLWNCQRTVMLA